MKEADTVTDPPHVYPLAKLGYRLVAERFVGARCEAIEEETNRLGLPDVLELPPDSDRRLTDQIIRAWLNACRPRTSKGHRKKIKNANDYLVLRWERWGNARSDRIDWPVRLPGLKPWAGPMRLDGLFWSRVDGVLDQPETPILDVMADVPSVSGLLPTHARANALDLGFDPAIIKKWNVPVGQELMTIFAFHLSPIVAYPDRTYQIGLDGPIIRRQARGQTDYGALVNA